MLGAQGAVKGDLRLVGRSDVICRIDDATVESMQPRGFRAQIRGYFCKVRVEPDANQTAAARQRRFKPLGKTLGHDS